MLVPVEKTRTMRHGFAALCALASVVAGSAVAEVAAPAGLAFVGLVDGEWRLFVTREEDALQKISTATEPRTPAYSARLARVAYIAADGVLRELDLRSGIDAELLRPSKTVAYTQPAYRPTSEELYVVALREGSSIETDIGRVDRSTQRFVVVLHQRSAQFEPSFTRDGGRMIYSNVACASECPKIIQEVWTMEMGSGVAEQLTLFNAVARQPAVDPQGAVVFASNREGFYQLWRATEAGGETVALTHERAVDESPVVSDSGDVYFIRRTEAGARLMRLDRTGEVAVVRLNASITDLRDLRWGQL
jgi:hypothetical protein